VARRGDADERERHARRDYWKCLGWRSQRDRRWRGRCWKAAWRELERVPEGEWL
jgi:hypothetical protein